MKQPGLDGRHRTLLGRISKKHGNTLVTTLLQHHKYAFLQGHPPGTDLEDILHTFHETSLSQLEKDYPATVK